MEETGKLHDHAPPPHEIVNANETHWLERFGDGYWKRLNEQIATHTVAIVGTMTTFYVFCLLAFTGFPGIPWVSCTPQQFTAWASSQLIQLILLPLIMVAQAVLNRHAELQADQQFNATMNAEHYITEIVKHLDKQDEERRMILNLVTELKDRNNG